jgi:hypothetical protein
MSHIEPLASYTPRGYFAIVSVARAIARPSENGIAAVLGVVLVGGVYADGWAHLNIGGLETFFTPWHAVLYGGFGLLVAWLAGMVLRRRRAGWLERVPMGYG